MNDNYPAKIAKYLLKGWCLLNEYCPNGTNIPLVKSREGALVCAGCDPSCPHFGTHGDHLLGAAATTSSSTAVPPPLPVSDVKDSSQDAKLGTFEPRVMAWQPEPVPASLSSTTQVVTERSARPPLGSVAKATPTPSGGTAVAEVGLEGTDLRFNCVKVATERGVPSRLAGDSYEVKLRMAVPTTAGIVFPGADGLREAVRGECEFLNQQVLVPKQCLARGPGEGQYKVVTEDGSSILLPQSHCQILPTGVSVSELAAWLWSRITSTRAAEHLRAAGASWLEVSLRESSGMEASFRGSLTAAAIPDW